MISEAAVEAIHGAICEESLEDHLDPDWPGRCVKALTAVYPLLAARALRDAVDAFPLETITAPDTAIVWLTRRAEQIEAAR